MSSESQTYRVQGRRFYMQGQLVEAGSILTATKTKQDNRPGIEVSIESNTEDLMAFVGEVFWASLLEEPVLGITKVM